MKRTLKDLAIAADGILRGDDREFIGVSTDTRTLSAGEVFFALTGPRFNASEFVAAAAAAGAAGAVVTARQDVAIPQIVVADPLAALSRSAAAWRAQFTIPVIGVAGSNGKTTVKEMTSSILRQTGECLSTYGNLNNHIGVPLTLWRLEDKHQFAVVEIGANHPGEVAALAAIARPTIGLVTNAGAEHLEGFGSLEGVARAEGEMYAALSPSDTAIINIDDPFAALWRSMTRAKIVTFGLAESAEFRATEVRPHVVPVGFATRFMLHSPFGEAPIRHKFAGRHNAVNALGAAAAAASAGASYEDVIEGLETANPHRGRLNFRLTRQGAWLVDDSYNANPSSMRASIDVLADLPGPTWLVIGDMGELGEHAAPSHIEVGRYARERGITRLFAIGPLSALAVESFGPDARWFPNVEAMTEALEAAMEREVCLLIKGSRMNRLERVVAALAVPHKAEQV